MLFSGEIETDFVHFFFLHAQQKLLESDKKKLVRLLNAKYFIA